MKDSIKCAFVFIGTIIGAGFATGQEILLYFRNSDISVCIFAGILMGIFCAFFLKIGNNINTTTDTLFDNKKAQLLYDASMFICAFISFIAMFSGAEVLFVQIFNISHMGIICVFLSIIVVLNEGQGIKFINSICVPIIIVFLIYVFCVTNSYGTSGKLNYINALTYTAMNIILGAGVMTKIGRGLDNKHIVISGFIVSIVFSIMLIIILLVVRGETCEIPILSVCKNEGLKIVGGGIIFMAIFTTMVSALNVASDFVNVAFRNRFLSLMFVILLAYPFKMIFTFQSIVNIFYPILSLTGIALLVLLLTFFYLKKCAENIKFLDKKM